MKRKYNHYNAHLKLKWKLDLIRPVIEENLAERNWERVEEEDMDFNFYWASVRTIKKIFNPSYRI